MQIIRKISNNESDSNNLYTIIIEDEGEIEDQSDRCGPNWIVVVEKMSKKIGINRNQFYR